MGTGRHCRLLSSTLHIFLLYFLKIKVIWREWQHTSTNLSKFTLHGSTLWLKHMICSIRDILPSLPFQYFSYYTRMDDIHMESQFQLWACRWWRPWPHWQTSGPWNETSDIYFDFWNVCKYFRCLPVQTDRKVLNSMLPFFCKLWSSHGVSKCLLGFQ